MNVMNRYLNNLALYFKQCAIASVYFKRAFFFI